jgi:hypothetical protein
MVMELRLLHPENASSPIAVTLVGMVMELRLLHPENALPPIAVTLVGMVMELRLLHPSNTLSPMAVTGMPPITAGIVTIAALPLYPVMV